MRHVPFSNLPLDVHQNLSGAMGDIVAHGEITGDAFHVRTPSGAAQMMTYEATYNKEGGGTLEITETAGGEVQRELSLRGLLSAVKAGSPEELQDRIFPGVTNGPTQVEGSVSFMPRPRRRHFSEFLLGRRSQSTSREEATKEIVAFIADFRKAVRS